MPTLLTRAFAASAQTATEPIMDNKMFCYQVRVGLVGCEAWLAKWVAMQGQRGLRVWRRGAASSACSLPAMKVDLAI